MAPPDLMPAPRQQHPELQLPMLRGDRIHNIQAVRPGMPVFKLSAKTGEEGIDEYFGFLAARLIELRQAAVV
jgi:hypothetical protein